MNILFLPIFLRKCIGYIFRCKLGQIFCCIYKVFKLRVRTKRCHFEGLKIKCAEKMENLGFRFYFVLALLLEVIEENGKHIFTATFSPLYNRDNHFNLTCDVSFL